jgi:LysM repeat protein
MFHMVQVMGNRRHALRWCACALMLWGMTPVHAQAFDPAAAEDAAIERQKLLRAADQLDLISTQSASLMQQVQELRSELEKLRAENTALRQQVTVLEKSRATERESILKEVSSIVAAGGRSPTSAPTTGNATPPAAPVKTPITGAGREEGFEHQVEHGQSLWAIAKAYQDAGVKVSVEEIKAANNLKDNNLRSGQKLFIPKK